MPYSDILKQSDFTFEEQGLLKINNSKVIVRYVTVFAAGWAVIAYLLADYKLLVAALIAFFGFLGGIILHEMKVHLTARVLWVMAANMAIFTASLVTPQEADMNFIFLATLTIPFVIFRPDEHRRWLTGLVVIAGSLWAISQIPGFHETLTPKLDAETAKAILSPAASFTTFGVVLFVVGYFTQKSEGQLKSLRSSHRELAAADRAKTRLLTSLSHEMRTPLHAIHGYSDLLNADLNALPPGMLKSSRGYPSNILKSCRSLLRVLENMFAFVTWNNQPFSPDIRQVNLRDQVRTILAEYQTDISGKTIMVDVDKVEELLLSTDRRMIALAFTQVIDNAIKFTPEGGRIDISTFYSDDGRIVFQITDTGPGFPKGSDEKAFTPFERLEFQTSSTPGVGTGLALARAALDRIGGRISIEGGSSVRISLPQNLARFPDQKPGLVEALDSAG